MSRLTCLRHRVLTYDRTLKCGIFYVNSLYLDLFILLNKANCFLFHLGSVKCHQEKKGALFGVFMLLYCSIDTKLRNGVLVISKKPLEFINFRWRSF